MKTTVYLPEELKRRIEETALREERSEAEVMRAALDSYTRGARPKPHLGFLHGGGRDYAARDEELLEGFGED
ncbi:MAG: ribbon-helix-helix domain-containing protein [Gaiellaceae bacterium]